MAELLTHALVAYALFTAFGWALEWLQPRWVVLGMVGSLFPDLNRIDMLVDDYAIEQLLGLPFDWGAIHTLGGVLLLSAVGALLFGAATARRRAFALLVAGGGSHLALDAVKRWAGGVNGAYLYPLTWWRNPTPGWYVSTDRWVLGVALACALVVFVVDRRAWILERVGME
jgi:hypothetical protein